MAYKAKKVNEFLDTTVALYGFSPLTEPKRRELKFKLALADVKDVVESTDLSLALDIVLSELQPKTSSLRTASVSNFGSVKSTCPRCSSLMTNVKISTVTDALYCTACHVTVPVR